MVTSRHQHGVDAAYTSPASRAKWVRLHFLGSPLPNPFPGAQPVKPELPITPQTRTLPAQPCATCHRNFFPLGYALENFDPIGRWRETDAGRAVDASGTLADGTQIHGPAALRDAILSRPDIFVGTVTQKLMTYALARGVEPQDMPAVRAIVRDAAQDDYKFSALVLGVVNSVPFQWKQQDE